MVDANVGVTITSCGVAEKEPVVKVVIPSLYSTVHGAVPVGAIDNVALPPVQIAEGPLTLMVAFGGVLTVINAVPENVPAQTSGTG